MNVQVFKSLRYNTMLLESLSWDDDKLKALFEYLESQFNADIPPHPKDISIVIKSNFGDDAAKCFTSILKEIMLESNLYFYKED